MAKQTSFVRGFKTGAEKTAIEFRKKLSLLESDPLCGFKLAEHLQIKVYSAIEIFPPGSKIEDLIGNENKNSGWSALTMRTSKGNRIIIHNHLHSPTRQQSDLMHELAHVICDHKVVEPEYQVTLPTLMRKYNKQQEDEAGFLGSALQISRPGLVWALKKRMEISEIAAHFGASESMVTLRINATGVKRQLKYLGY